MKSLLTVFVVLSAAVMYAQESENTGMPRQIQNKYAVKFTPTQLIMGELNLGVEFKIARRVSMDIELGPTLSYAGLGGRTILDYEDSQQSSLTREGSFGYFGALGFRYYLFENTDALTRLYIHPQLKYRVYNTWIEEDTGAWGRILAQNTQYKFLFNVGWQLWASRSFGFDFYLGGGLGYRQLQTFEQIIVYDNYTISYEWDEKMVSRPQLLLNAGIKIAIGG